MARPILLAVDDDTSVLEAVVQDLRRQYGAEYRVMRAASGQAALDTLEQLKARPLPGGAAGAADGLCRYRSGHPGY